MFPIHRSTFQNSDSSTSLIPSSLRTSSGTHWFRLVGRSFVRSLLFPHSFSRLKSFYNALQSPRLIIIVKSYPHCPPSASLLTHNRGDTNRDRQSASNDFPHPSPNGFDLQNYQRELSATFNGTWRRGDNTTPRQVLLT